MEKQNLGLCYKWASKIRAKCPNLSPKRSVELVKSILDDTKILEIENIQFISVTEWIEHHFTHGIEYYFKYGVGEHHLPMIWAYKQRFGDQIIHIRDNIGNRLILSETGRHISIREYDEPETTWWFKDHVDKNSYDSLIEDCFDDPKNQKTIFRNKYLRHRKYGFTYVPEYAFPEFHWKEDHKNYE